MGGGNECIKTLEGEALGLSPRGRGKRIALYAVPAVQRSIPAWAGETGGAPSSRTMAEVYPRVGGGNPLTVPDPFRLLGLSPRGRGKPICLRSLQGGNRSIPAWAGETAVNRFYPVFATVYPRVGGGNDLAGVEPPAAEGLSPRGRGKQVMRPGEDAYVGSIPAWAGETNDNAPEQPLSAVYPRVGGGNPHSFHSGHRAQGLSPRGRGKRILPLA